MLHTEFTLLGDAVWLDFVNTSRGRVHSPPDLLSCPDALARWARTQSLEWNEECSPTLEEALLFRDRLTSLAEALHAEQQPPTASIAAINEQLSRQTGHHQLTRISGEWQLRFAPVRRPTMLMAIAASAAEVLSRPLLLVRRCAGESCSLFFTDDSPNEGRRWCSSAVCGRQVRVERRRGLLR
ncbi:MAG TPA: CGNR zinc finger domain-containing protein [Gemmatimonadales bacterium]|nr:CGNR zinc finger domain-containing protein [Gemmatimonadales bacterium]